MTFSPHILSHTHTYRNLILRKVHVWIIMCFRSGSGCFFFHHHQYISPHLLKAVLHDIIRFHILIVMCLLWSAFASNPFSSWAKLVFESRSRNPDFSPIICKTAKRRRSSATHSHAAPKRNMNLEIYENDDDDDDRPSLETSRSE